MARKIPPHESLGGQQEPAGWNGGADEMTVTLNYKNSAEFPDQIQFVFEVDTTFPYKEPEGDLQFEIQRDCTIRFILHPKLNSRWSKQYYFITGKKPYRHLYGDVALVDERTFTVKAKYNTAGAHNDRQSFNLNIDYGQVKAADGKWSYLPITIDPDVGNPRPPGVGLDIAGPKTIALIGTVEE
jgi:hypothetical protein